MPHRSHCRGLFAWRNLALFLLATSHGGAIAAPPGWEPDKRFPEPVHPSATRAGREQVSVEPTALASPFTTAVSGGDNCSDATPVTINVGPEGAPNVVTITGNSSAATGPECGNIIDGWWEAFTLDKCAEVTIDFCTTSPILRPYYTLLLGSCSSDGSSCGDFIDAISSNNQLCANPEIDTNITMTFSQLAPGTYYYPIIANGVAGNVPGPYVMHIAAEECSGPCSGCRGGCCNIETNTCTDDVEALNCTDSNQNWTRQTRCCEIECRDFALAEYDTLNVNLLARVSIEDFGAFNGTPGNPHSANEMGGYTSPLGRKYAILGFTTGIGFVDVTDPRNSIIVDYFPSVVGSVWRDMDTFEQYTYVVTDGVGVGLEIFDLSDIDSGNINKVGIATGGLTTAHNVYVNKQSARGYACGAAPLGSGFVVYSLADPADPLPIGAWSDFSVHDLQVVNYDACPSDPGHVRFGQPCEIAFCFIGDGVKILDVTDPTLILTLSTLTYPTLGYCHQGRLSDDRRYVFFNDELDERDGTVSNTRTYVADVQVLTSPKLVEEFDHPGCWIDHNLTVRGVRVYGAHYSAGLRVLDASNPLVLAEVAYFDTRPEDNQTGFPGAWGVFTDYSSRIVAVSDRQRGLFVVCDETDKPIAGFVVDQNPQNGPDPISFNGSVSTTCDAKRSLVSWEWDFDYDGDTFDIQATGVNVQHSFDFAGTYAVALRVTDDQSAQDVSAFDITVNFSIPAVSTWGLLVLAMLLLTVGTIATSMRHRSTDPNT